MPICGRGPLLGHGPLVENLRSMLCTTYFCFCYCLSGCVVFHKTVEAFMLCVYHGLTLVVTTGLVLG